MKDIFKSSILKIINLKKLKIFKRKFKDLIEETCHIHELKIVIFKIPILSKHKDSN